MEAFSKLFTVKKYSKHFFLHNNNKNRMLIVFYDFNLLLFYTTNENLFDIDRKRIRLAAAKKKILL